MERALKLMLVVIAGGMLLNSVNSGVRHIGEKISNSLKLAEDPGKVKIERRVKAW